MLRWRRVWRDGSSATGKLQSRTHDGVLALVVFMAVCSIVLVWRGMAEGGTRLPKPIAASIIANNSRLRGGADTNAPVLARLDRGDFVQVVAYTRDGWYKVESSKGEGWISCGLIEGDAEMPFEPIYKDRRRKCRRKSDGEFVSQGTP